MALERELETYKQHRESLLDKQGKFVVIHQDDVAGVWDTYADALKAGYDRFKLDPFLVKQIVADEQVQFITRDVEFPCRT
jgi:hypothetical protein